MRMSERDARPTIRRTFSHVLIALTVEFDNQDES